MNCIFLSYGLNPNNIQLMPWKYVLEIAKGIMNNGNNVIIISDGKEDYALFPNDLPSIHMVNGNFSKSNKLYQNYIKEFKPDVIFFPISRRSIFTNKIYIFNDIPHIAYFPSAWYRPKFMLSLFGELPIVDTITYTLESLVPGNWLVRTLKKKKVLAVNTVTEHTANQFIKFGWPKDRIGVFPPGVDSSDTVNISTEIYRKYIEKIGNRKYILFMGPLKAIRGIYFLIEAFDHVATILDEILLVCLIRNDINNESKKFQRILNRLKRKDRIIVVQEALKKEDIFEFIKESHAVVFPFLLIPSEIPISVIEVLSFGKPIIITNTGGTSEFVGKSGIVVPPNDINALIKGIVDICSDMEHYKIMSLEAQKIINNQVSWAQLAKNYLAFTEKMLSIQ